ncbi:MAG: 2-oxoglutarate dehydrogenase E1 component [Phycisphaerales bacterium]|nr:2-oxoglutarate dehydrogenase E1 component [Phycisphaerales bacterium]
MDGVDGQPTAGPGLTRAAASLNGWNAQYVEQLHRQWQQDPASVPGTWAEFFRGFELGASEQPSGEGSHLQAQADALIRRFRQLGCFGADLDPLGLQPRDMAALTPESVGIDHAALDTPIDTGDLPLPEQMPLRSVIDHLHKAWCGSLTAEVEHIRDPAKRGWLREAIESRPLQAGFDTDTRLRILRELQQATGLERFLMRRYVGKKWFSLEGGESLIPMLNELLVSASLDGVEEIAFGMAHRGRINVLVNILEKGYDQLFTEFDESWGEDFIAGGGDVKYHRGYSADIVTDAGQPLHVTMSSNPSHLEWGHPVVIGRVRAKQRLRGDETRRTCLPLLVHGDASLPGQGVVQELLNLGRLDGYDVGGTLHLVINNQVGFTAEAHEATSGRFCTDIFRAFDFPVLHVNADDPEACVQAMDIAFKWRQRFGEDIVIDLVGYRKYGHNETDEPTFTNPVMYAAVKQQRPVVEQYAESLSRDGLIGADEADQATRRLLEIMDEAQTRVKETPVTPVPPAFDDTSTWAGLSDRYHADCPESKVDRATLQRITDVIASPPAGFTVHRKLQRLLDKRSSAVADDAPLDWAMGELLAWGSLLVEGIPIRLTGEDCARGTFSHRHAVLFDAQNGDQWMPLNCLGPGQARMCVHNSPVSEAGCIGFEYGYSLGDPHMLVIWEAQFGDFANAGQVYFDQFLASAEKKWQRHSGLVCFLPHGYEGQGPEHSSARMERMLQLCADNNMEVVNPTTPAQVFHMLRRQMLRGFRKPLIVFTPKSLLRHPAAVSTVSDLTDGEFQCVIDDANADPARTTRLIFCTGKVYYDLVAHRAKCDHSSQTAIVRLEQLHPLPKDEIEAILNRYDKVHTRLWVQEEPLNAGAWEWMSDRFREHWQQPLQVISRPANASPAVASTHVHADEQHHLLVEALGLETTSPQGEPSA